MKIAIIGAGAIGKLLATYYAPYHEVTLVPRRKEQCEQLNHEGVTVIGEVTATYNVLATLTLPPADLYIVTVKYHHLANLAPLLKGVKTTLLFLQNGLAHQTFAKQFTCEVIMGTLTAGAENKDDTTVYARGQGAMTVSIAEGHFLFQLQHPQLPIIAVSDVQEVLWRKALMNCLINPLTALLNICNGELVTNRYANQLMRALYEELMLVFPDKKQLISIEEVEQLCHNTAMNTSSMRADFLAERTSELPTIVGPLLEEASNRQGQLPMMQTIYYALLAIEERRN